MPKVEGNGKCANKSGIPTENKWNFWKNKAMKAAE